MAGSCAGGREGCRWRRHLADDGAAGSAGCLRGSVRKIVRGVIEENLSAGHMG